MRGTMTNRLAPQDGEWVDRSRSLSFSFEGKKYSGFDGDTITSALWASGQHVLGRSFKYHRPRGTLSLADHDANAMVQDGSLLNVRADVTPLKDGRKLKAVNTVGGLKRDLGQINNRLAPFLPVGFYYKSFHKPARLFPYWERFIRRAAGLGYVTADDERRRWGKGYGFADVLVVGAGPSGLSAAISAAEAGAKVVLVDENPRAGGTLTYAKSANEGGRELLAGLSRKVEANPNIEFRPDTVASAHFEDHWVPLVNMEHGMTKMRVKALVVAGGAMEQPAVFRNNDLPGVMLGSAVQRLIHRYSVKPFDRGVVLAANSDAYGVALDLLRAEVQIAAVVDLRREGEESALGAAVRDAGVKIYAGHCIYEAQASKKGMGVAGTVITPLDVQNNPVPSRGFEVECDGIAMSVGWAANAALLAQSGCSLNYSEDLHQFVPVELAKGVFAAGRVNGVYRTQDKVRDGERAGLLATQHVGRAGTGAALEQVPRHSGAAPSHPYPVYDHHKGMAFVDLDEDVQLKDIKNSIQEGFDSIALVNRFATLGMGPSQGKHSNMNGIRIVARLMTKSIDETGTITSRPFLHPVPMGILSGRSFHPERRTPMHRRHEEHGAVFMRAGDWLRPEYYATPGADRDGAILAEVRAVRKGVGLIDVGTLGKVEISGPDALEVVERICTGRFAKLKVGMTRYALMTDEAGVITDDGVCARLADDHFYLTATTSGVAALYREITRWVQIWGFDAEVMNYSNAYTAMNLAGPRSREVLSRLTGLDLSREEFPYLAWREGKIAGVPARAMRVGFVGELGYEIHVSADNGLFVWDRIMEAGEEFGIKPFGVEAQRRLRLEKGHIIIGQDTDGLTSPWEVNMGWAVKLDKPFFVGQRTLKILEKRGVKQQQRGTEDRRLIGQRAEDRKLVGFALMDGTQGLMPKECHLVIENGGIIGRVTSVAYSEAVGKVIGLAFLPSNTEVGSRFQIRVDGGEMVDAEVVPTPFYDPDNSRQKGAEKVVAQQGGKV
jgi:sarcosine oxidase, subunit alpha